MTELIDEIIVERTPMRDLASRLLELLQDARITACIASHASLEVAGGGDCVAAVSFDLRVPGSFADRARRVLAEARRGRRMTLQTRPRQSVSALVFRNGL